MTQHKGFIFFFTLCMIALMSVLILTAMQQQLLYYQLINKQKRHQQQIDALERSALHLAQNTNDYAANNKCDSRIVSANEVLIQLLAGKGCIFKTTSQRYRYFIDSLAINPCAIIKTSDKSYASFYQRISIIAQDKQEKNTHLLQLTVIKPVDNHICTGLVYNVIPGISSWRYIADSNELRD